MTTKAKRLNSDIDQVRQALEAWRKTRQHRDRIPEPLWGAMTRLARTYGVSPVSSALGVEYYALKERVETGRSTPPFSSPSSQSAFIELKPLPAAAPATWLVELEDRSGAKMTLRLDPGAGVDPVALLQSFWRRSE